MSAPPEAAPTAAVALSWAADELETEPVCALLARAELRCTRRLRAASGQVRVVVAQR